MKKFLSVLSLLLLLWTESLSPLAFVYAEPDEETVVEEQLDQEESQEQESEVPESFEEISENNEDDQWLSDEVNEEIPVEPQEWTDQQDDIVVQESPEEIQTVDSSDEEWVESIAEEKIELLGEETESSEQEDWDVITTEMIPLEEEKLEEFTIDNTIVEDYEEADYSDMEYIPWEVVVKYVDEIPEEETPTFVSNVKSFFKNIAWITTDEVSLIENNLEVKEQIDSENTTAVLEIKDDKTVEEAIELLQEDPRVEFVEPNYIRYLYTSIDNYDANDALKNSQYWLELISWPDAMEIYSGYLSKDNNDIIVWVVDNGVNYYHPDLDNNMWSPSSCLMDGNEINCSHGYDFFHDKPTPLPNVWDHGTHIAWIIGAEMNNGIGTIWVNPYVKIAALKAWNGNILTSSSTTKAINFARENGIRILNWSYWANKESVLEKQAIQAFWEAWWLFIAAAGNEKANMEIEENKQYPCAYDLDNIICVASVWKEWNIFNEFSNFGTTEMLILQLLERILIVHQYEMLQEDLV